MKKLVLITNNRFQDPFLHSQLINVYKDSPFDEIHLFCGINSVDKEISSKIKIHDNLIDSKSGLIRFVCYYIKLVRFFFNLRKDNVVVHLRGFVGAFMYFFTPRSFNNKRTIIYDPRGAFIFGKQEVHPKFKRCFELLRIVEIIIIKKSLFTIVESKKLKKQMTLIYGLEEKYITCYNASSFGVDGLVKEEEKNRIKIGYCGSVNHWHDVDEIKRVFVYLNKIFKDYLVDNYIYTQKRNHELVNTTFQDVLFKYNVSFVPYNDLEERLVDLDVCISVVKPNKSTEITSPIKISDYIMLNKKIILNSGIGDFDNFFITNNSAIIYDFEKELKFTTSDILNLNIHANESLKNKFSTKTNTSKIMNRLKN